jgi:hypothetical protein
MVLEVAAYFLVRLDGTMLKHALNFVFLCALAEHLCLNRKEPIFFGSLEDVTSVVGSDRIARLVSVQALIDTGILSLIDLFLIEILL